MSNTRLPLFFAVSTFMWFAVYAYIPFVAPYGEEMGADFRMIGIIAGAYGLTQMLLRFPLGILSDRLRMRKNFIILGLLISALSGFIVFLMPSPLTLLASRGLAGVAVSSWVIFMILGPSYYRREETTKAVGYLNGTTAFARVTSFLLGGIIAERLGFSYVFLLSGIAGTIGLFLAFGIVEKKPEVQGEPPRVRDLLGVAKNKQLLSAAFLGVLSQIIPFATTFGFVPMTAIELGASNMQLSMLALIAILPGIFISPMAGTVFPQKFGIKSTLVVGFLLAGLGSVAVPFCQYLWQLFAVQVVSFTGSTITLTLLMGLCIRDIPNEQRGTAMGLFQAVYGFGMFLGPFAMGWVSHGFGLVTAFIFTGVIGLIGAVATVVYINKGHLRFS